ncbi:MAG TPA: GFA family protein [Kiloniellaceae bacterium]|nr:GFA family protein [Kiloniellaceae bacterium]
MKVEGGCHCGAIAFEAEIDPEKVILCHCTDCQTLSGAPYRSVAFTRPGGFTLLRGELKTYVKTADSGNRRAQTFCPDCGAPIYAASLDEGPKVYGLRVGALKQRAQLKPKAQYWTHSAQDWVQDLSGVEKIGGD